MKLKMDAETLVLAALANGPRHGYGIAMTIRDRSDELLKLGEGQLYPILHRFEKLKWIEGGWEESPSGPPKRVYRLLEEGHKELAKRTAEWNTFVEAVGSVLGQTTPEVIRG